MDDQPADQFCSLEMILWPKETILTRELAQMMTDISNENNQ